MPFTIVYDDITKMRADAIVNAANTELQKGGGVCGAIFNAAGTDRLQIACDALAPIRTGEAVLTPGFDLCCKYVIHTAGPVYRDGKQGEEALLRQCYQNAFKRAVEKGCESIAFPLISGGIYGYPRAEALRVAIEEIRRFLSLEDGDMTVWLVMLDKASFVINEKLLDEVRRYMRRRVAEGDVEEEGALEPAPRRPTLLRQAKGRALPAAGLEERIANRDEPFSATLLRLIDQKGKTDVEVYKRANIDRRLFSKIRSDPEYRPSKRTAVALAIALELTLAQTNDLLEKAGYALSGSQVFDVIIEYFVSHARHDVFEINEVLFHYDQPLLGG